MFFTILGVKRNLMALLGTFAVVAINYFLFMIFMPIGALLPFILTISICDFMAVYAAYPNIIKYMMDERDAQAIIEKRSFEYSSGKSSHGYGDDSDDDFDEEYNTIDENIQDESTDEFSNTPQAT